MSQLSLQGALKRQSKPDDSSSKSRVSFFRHLLKRVSGKTIYVYGEPYLTRYYLIGNGSGKSMEVYVHHMHKVDEFRWLHNHPWSWFFALVLSGSYLQETIDVRTQKTGYQHIRVVNLFKGFNRYHAIRKLPNGSAWTLVVVPPKRSDYEWGYWDSARKIHVEDNTIGHESAETKSFGTKELMD